MELKRFFVSPDAIVGDNVTVTCDEYVHMTAVLRFRVGYRCIVCDNSGMDYLCEVQSIDRTSAYLKVLSISKNDSELDMDVTLCLGVIKQEKMEYSIQKAVELGVKYIQPFISEHTDEKRVRYDRAERIILESCKQCGRAKTPVILPVKPYSEIFDSEGLYLMAYENENQLLLRDAVRDNYTKNTPVSIIVGSEGGFTTQEVQFAQKQGAVVCSLGKRILRAETASVVAIGTLTALTEEL